MKYIEIIKLGTDILRFQNIRNPSLDAELLLSKTLNLKREKILANSEDLIDKQNFLQYMKLIDKRKNKMPIAQIFEKKNFWKKNFVVNREVLIPRPDSEILIENSLKLIDKDKSYNILDIGTGCGCLIISILLERTNCKGVALDKSKSALKVAKTNAKMQHILNRIKFINSDIDKFYSNKYDFIISNPPYVKSSSLLSLDEDIKRFEPLLALNGGSDGCKILRMVIKKSSELLKRNGGFILEIDDKQTEVIKDMLKKYDFHNIKVIKDLSGKNRCLSSTKK